MTQKQNDHQCTGSHQTPRAKKGRISCLNLKAMLIVLFDIQGVMMAEWVPSGHIVNQHYYIEVLTKLHERMRRKQPGLSRNSWILHQDSIFLQPFSSLI
jgi:hypothetical protein